MVSNQPGMQPSPRGRRLLEQRSSIAVIKDLGLQDVTIKVDLGVGDPRTPIPADVRMATIDASDSMHYAPGAGISELGRGSRRCMA